MVELQVNRDAAVDYVAKRCGHQGDIGEAQGVLLMQDGAPAGAVVFHGFYKMEHGSMCEMSAAIDDAGVLTRGIVRAVLDYPFNQAKVVRLAVGDERGQHEGAQDTAAAWVRGRGRGCGEAARVGR